MTSRERVMMALEHKEPDKLPIDCGGMQSTGIMGIAYNNLKKYLGMPEGETKMYDPVQQLAIPEQWYLDNFQIDVVDLSRAYANNPDDWFDWTLPDGSTAKMPAWLHFEHRDDEWICIDEDGDITARMPKGTDYFTQMIYPLRGIRRDNFDDLVKQMGKSMWAHMSGPLWKNADKPEFWSTLRQTAKKMYEESDYAIMLGFGGNLFEWGQFLYRTDEFLMNLMTNRREMEKMLDTLTEIHLEKLDRTLEAISGYVQIIQMGDDLGTQGGPMIDPKLYHELFFPRHKKIYQRVKDKSDIRVFLHSCGGIYEFIPDLIEAGVDVLNPVQIGAKGMDPKVLKNEFGNDLVFWGGGVDTQHVLSLATPDEVRRDVRKNCEVFMKNGGFIFCQVHNIVAGVSPENVVAMYEEANNIRY